MFGIMDIVGILEAILVLGVLVFVHELGHFLMAKINGIGVDAFSIGFGKEIFGFTIGETRYRISWIPLGGYCQLRGEESKDRSESAKKDPRAMYNRPPLARLLAVLGGPVSNYLFAVLVMTVLFLGGFKETFIPSYVAVVPSNADGSQTPAWIAGLRSGDRIISIDGQKVEYFSDIPELVALKKDEKLFLSYLHNGITNTNTIIPRYSKEKGFGFIGVSPLYLPVVGLVQSNSPAFEAGVLPGDTIESIGGKKVSYFYELQDAIKHKTNQEILLGISRSNVFIAKNIRIGRFEGNGYLGIASGKVPTVEKFFQEKNVVVAFQKGLEECNLLLVKTIKGLGALFQGKIDVQKNISGPIRIVQLTGEVAAKTDFVTLVRLVVLISVALGFFNLLPFPGLDGGHVVFNLIELISRRKFPETLRRYIEYAGLAFIIALSIVVLFNDVFNIWMGR
jgi:regulator of sigma E protease